MIFNISNGSPNALQINPKFLHTVLQGHLASDLQLLFQVQRPGPPGKRHHSPFLGTCSCLDLCSQYSLHPDRSEERSLHPQSLPTPTTSMFHASLSIKAYILRNPLLWHSCPQASLVPSLAKALNCSTFAGQNASGKSSSHPRPCSHSTLFYTNIFSLCVYLREHASMQSEERGNPGAPVIIFLISSLKHRQ